MHVTDKNIFKTAATLENASKISRYGEECREGFEFKILLEYQSNRRFGGYRYADNVTERAGVRFIINTYFSGF